jgi:DNA-binding Xre family transcriptional regulator
MIDLGINKSQLRERAGVSTNVIAKMGKSEPVPMEALAKICNVLECSIGDIVVEDGEEKNK